MMVMIAAAKQLFTIFFYALTFFAFGNEQNWLVTGRSEARWWWRKHITQLISRPTKKKRKIAKKHFGINLRDRERGGRNLIIVGSMSDPTFAPASACVNQKLQKISWKFILICPALKRIVSITTKCALMKNIYEHLTAVSYLIECLAVVFTVISLHSHGAGWGGRKINFEFIN